MADSLFFANHKSCRALLFWVESDRRFNYLDHRFPYSHRKIKLFYYLVVERMPLSLNNDLWTVHLQLRMFSGDLWAMWFKNVRLFASRTKKHKVISKSLPVRGLLSHAHGSLLLKMCIILGTSIEPYCISLPSANRYLLICTTFSLWLVKQKGTHFFWEENSIACASLRRRMFAGLYGFLRRA